MSKPVTDTRSVWCSLFLSLLVALLLPACASQGAIEEQERQAAKTLEERQAVFSMQIDRVLQRQDADKPGVSVKVVQHGVTLYSRVKGMADIKGALPISTTTVFSIASISKPMTAVAVMQLVERGRLSLDDPVTKWLPDLPQDWGDITIHALLSHQSGIDLNHVLLLDGMSNKDVLERMSTDKAIRPDVRGPAKYSNGNFILLAEIIEKASGVSYSQYMASNIFSPAGMVDAFVHEPATLSKASVALNYGTSRQIYGMRNTLNGGGGIFASTDDLETFSQNLLSGKLISQESLRLMTSDHSHAAVSRHDFSSHYGYGWYVSSRSEGGKVFWHSGGADGYETCLYIDQERELIAILMSNGGGATVKVLDAVLDLIVKTYPGG